MQNSNLKKQIYELTKCIKEGNYKKPENIDNLEEKINTLENKINTQINNLNFKVENSTMKTISDVNGEIS
ncbi:uncharacterized protein VNE69_02099 [Vairimorpha necatrix]|uniref:Uncharacterized protein n=1 Tax=Vairimorpha necatrix TaxID=6039 RepID=A0AAX4J9L8_9MICR